MSYQAEYKLLLVLPKDKTLNYSLVSKNAGFITRTMWGSPPLSLATIAALTPLNFKTKIIDENIEEIDFNEYFDLVGITGNSFHIARAEEIAIEFSKRRVVIVCGGYSVSVCPERWRSFANVLIIGEAERIWPEFLDDFISGTYKNEYVEKERFNLSVSPLPDYSSIATSTLQKYSYGVVQISRGCPFRCEFCSVTVYAGNKIRYKPVDNIIKEIHLIHNTRKYRFIHIADDNFAGDIQKAKEILIALKEWNSKQRKPVSFITQLSADAAKDEEFLALSAEAGLNTFSIGFETPNIESLKEVGKYHYINININEYVKKIHQYGITIMGNCMIGFDNDDPSIFKMQYKFFSELGIANVNVYPLLAFDGAPLKERMMKEGRYIERNKTLFGKGHIFNMLSASNIIPKNMSVGQLHHGIIWLLKELYNPEKFIERFEIFFKDFEESDKKRDISILKAYFDFAVIGVVLRLIAFLLLIATSSEKRTFFKMFIIASKSSHPQRFNILMFYFLRFINNRSFINNITKEFCNT
ncbi:MAG: radical SAM protein [Bacteroidales bacterium]|nr:radical SAM protein [Bacteroidales bacterium]